MAASTKGIIGEMIRDMMIMAVKQRFVISLLYKSYWTLIKRARVNLFLDCDRLRSCRR